MAPSRTTAGIMWVCAPNGDCHNGSTSPRMLELGIGLSACNCAASTRSSADAARMLVSGCKRPNTTMADADRSSSRFAVPSCGCIITGMNSSFTMLTIVP